MQTQKTSGTTTPLPDNYLSPEWIYDAMMEEIDPDLTTYNIQSLDDFYRGESEGERVKRFERYTVSFQIFVEALEELKEQNLIFEKEMASLMDSIALRNEGDKSEKAIQDIENQLNSDTAA